MITAAWRKIIDNKFTPSNEIGALGHLLSLGHGPVGWAGWTLASTKESTEHLPAFIPDPRHGGVIQLDLRLAAQEIQQDFDALPARHHARDHGFHGMKGAARHSHFVTRLKSARQSRAARHRQRRRATRR